MKIRSLLSFLILFVFAGNLFSQSISGINPNQANRGQTLPVAISGQNTSFGQGTSTTNVWFTQGSSTIVYPFNVTIQNSTSLTANFTFINNLPTGLYDVHVQNSLNGSMIVQNGFLLNPNPTPPVIISANPDTAGQGQTLCVTITGQFTNFSQATSTSNVWFSQGTSTLIYPNSINIVNDTSIVACFTIPNNTPLGFYNVNTNYFSDGHLIHTNGFYVDLSTMTVSVTSQAAVSCNGGSNGSASVNVNGGVAPYTYYWSPYGGTNSSATGLSAGTYSVTITDHTGNNTFKTVTITQPSAIYPSVSVTNASSCTNSDGSATANVFGGTPPYTYSWSTGNTTSLITGLAPGTYTLTVADVNGCSKISSPTVYCGLLGISQPTSSEISIEVYPNPSNGIFTIRSSEEISYIEILNILGEKFYSSSGNFREAEIDLNSPPKGIYFIKVYSSNEISFRKIVVQ